MHFIFIKNYLRRNLYGIANRKQRNMFICRARNSFRSFISNKFLRKTQKTNPLIVLQVAELMRVTGDEKNVLIATAAVYRMLESQAGADNLKKLFILK